eukprot:Nk52_evm6s259 gene=Nk52_evmTU6s259
MTQATKRAAAETLVPNKGKISREMSPARSVTLNETDDVRIARIDPLIPPQILMEDISISAAALSTVAKTRCEVGKVMRGEDDRLIVVVGPCSIHDPKAALEYGNRLKKEMEKYSKELLIIMRVYFEKPRTTVGWKGHINDPSMNGKFAINKGLKSARKLLLSLNDSGIPCGCEFLDTLTPQFVGDLVSWGAIGARTTESQVHRELASGLSCAVGFKNGTSGDVKIAVDAIGASIHPHHFLSVTKQGLAAIVTTEGNQQCHLILRGGADGPNYGEKHVAAAIKQLQGGKVLDKIVIDCSHGNSRKKHENQPVVAENIGSQIAAGNKNIVGVMLESHLVEGRQDIPKNVSESDDVLTKLTYGQSITDACIGWETTVDVLKNLAADVKKRRQLA